MHFIIYEVVTFGSVATHQSTPLHQSMDSLLEMWVNHWASDCSAQQTLPLALRDLKSIFATNHLQLFAPVVWILVPVCRKM